MLKHIWHEHKSSILLVGVVLLIVTLPTFLYLKLKKLESKDQAAVSVAQLQPTPTSTPQSTQNQIASLADNNCTAQVIACDQQFKDNKTLACGTFKGQVVDELLTRDESPCKGMDRTYVEGQLDEACSKGCLPSPTPTKTPTPTPSPTSTPTPTATPSPTPSPTPEDKLPTATPSETDSIVLENISFSLAGIGLDNFENNSPKNLIRTVHAILYSDSTNEIVTQTDTNFAYNTSTGKFNGNITFNAPKNAIYYATMRTDVSLTKKVASVVTVTLIAGDLNTDNQMTIEDYNAMVACYKALPSCSDSIRTKADLNDDGAIDIDDINIMQRAFSTGKGELVGD